MIDGLRAAREHVHPSGSAVLGISRRDLRRAADHLVVAALRDDERSFQHVLALSGVSRHRLDRHATRFRRACSFALVLNVFGALWFVSTPVGALVVAFGQSVLARYAIVAASLGIPVVHVLVLALVEASGRTPARRVAVTAMNVARSREENAHVRLDPGPRRRR